MSANNAVYPARQRILELLSRHLIINFNINALSEALIFIVAWESDKSHCYIAADRVSAVTEQQV